MVVTFEFWNLHDTLFRLLRRQSAIFDTGACCFFCGSTLGSVGALCLLESIGREMVLAFVLVLGSSTCTEKF